MPAGQVQDMEYNVRSVKRELRKERTPHPAPRTPRVFTYRRAVERLARADVDSALLDAACLMEAASGVRRWRFIVEPERAIASGTSDLLEAMLCRREAREPIAYILGVKEFWSLSLSVGRGVLIPRPETETLVEAVLEKIRFEFRVSSFESIGVPSSEWQAPGCKPETRNPELRILDLGTGCGAIALALAREIPHARLYALDSSADAVRIASRNAKALGLAGKVRFVQGDLFEPLRAIQHGFDLIVSNPPYIPSGQLSRLPPEVLAYEPHQALDGGEDGLHFHRRIIEEVPARLRANGWLAVEIGEGQAPSVMRLIDETEIFGPVGVKQDLSGRDRVILAQRRPRPHG
jgi:release factor glutamine methyltransferase